MTKDIVVSGFAITDRGGLSRLSCRIRSDGFPDRLTFDVRSFPSDTEVVREPNWAVAALIHLAMLTGRDLHIEADISQMLWTAAQCDLQAFLRAGDPRLRRIRVSAGWAAAPETRATGSAMGFSAGVDSFATLSLYTGEGVPEALRLRRLAVHDVGAFGAEAHRDRDFERACRRAADLAGRMGLEMALVRSNLGHLYRCCAPASIYQQSHTLRNAAAAHVLGDGVGAFLYSSGFAPQEIGVDKVRRDANGAIAHVDPILLPLLSTERLRLVSAGAGLSRGEKTAIVAASPEAQAQLDVCVSARDRALSGRINCSRCWKCVRSMAMLEAVGALDRFEAVFDLAHYRANRRRLLAQLAYRAGCGSGLDREAVAMLEAAGLRVPVVPGVIGRARSVARGALRTLRRGG